MDAKQTCTSGTAPVSFFIDVSHKSKNQAYHQNMRNIGIFCKNLPKTRTSCEIASRTQHYCKTDCIVHIRSMSLEHIIFICQYGKHDCRGPNLKMFKTHKNNKLRMDERW